MAALTITATNVVAGDGAVVVKDFPFGETVTAGMSVYLKASDSKWWKAQADGTADQSGSGVRLGIALNGGAANQPAAVQTGGRLTIGATVAAGVFYYVGLGAGEIGPAGDLGSTNYVSQIAYGVSTSVVVVNPLATGVVLA